MGVDFARIVTSVMIGVVIFGVFVAGITDIGNNYNFAFTPGATFGANSSFTTAKVIEQSVQNAGANSQTNPFLPGVPSVFTVWQLVKSSVSDLSNMIETFAGIIGGGFQGNSIKTAIILSITVAVAFIILAIILNRAQLKVN
jgi:hypothetical protein